MIIPVVGDHEHLRTLLNDLSRGSFAQVIVSCGDDSAYDFLNPDDTLFIRSQRGRGRQISLAIEQAQGQCIWVLHADVRVSPKVLKSLRDQSSKVLWGAFKVELSGNATVFRVIGNLMNFRSRLMSIYTGDQGMFFRCDLLSDSGGFPTIDLLEDVECSRRLRRIKRGVQLDEKLAVSTRKWQREGIFRTIVRMWIYRLMYFFGASPNRLAQRYYHSHR